MVVKLFLLFLLFLAITPNLGFFSLPSLVVLGFILFNYLIFFNGNRGKEVSRRWDKNIRKISSLNLFVLLFFSAFYYGGLYQEQKSVLAGQFFILSLIFLLFFNHYLPNRKTFDQLILPLIIIAYLSTSFWTLHHSPNPVVDTIIVLKEAPLKLLEGENPYAAEFSRVYPTVEPNYYNYLPLSFLYSLPFVLILKDPRYGIIFANLISLAILYRLFREKMESKMINLFLAVFLFLPGSFFMLEHAYLDPVVFSFFLLHFYFLKEQKDGLALFFFSLFFLFKQQVALLFPLYLLNKKFRLVFFKPQNLLLFLLPTSLPLIFLIINPRAFLDDIFFSLSPEKITSPISASLTFPALLNNLTFNQNFSTVYLLSGFLFSAFYFGVLRRGFSLIQKIPLTILLFNFFMFHAFFNGYYFLALFLFLEIILDFFKVNYL